jgi:predicted amidohydrolase
MTDGYEIMEQPATTFSVGFLQFDVQLGDLAANLGKVEAGLNNLRPSSPGIVLLPEMWAAGFAYARLVDLALQTEDILRFLVGQADRYRVMLGGSLPEIINDGGTVIHNTLYIVDPDGVIGTYRKQRLFAPLLEDAHLAAGSDQHAIQTPLGKMAALICYDLRFPELLRPQVAQGAVLLLTAAQWPLVRKDHWRILLAARAIENQMFVIGANRCGTDSLAGGTTYAGHSMIIAPDGAILHEAGDEEEAASITIDLTMVDDLRTRFNTSMS